MDMKITDAEAALGYRGESHLMKEWTDANAIYNIELSLRRIANSLENQKLLDDKFVECSKLSDENRRLVLDCEAFKHERDRAEGKAAHFEKECERLQKLLQPVVNCDTMGCTRGSARGYCQAVDAVRDVKEAIEKGGAK